LVHTKLKKALPRRRVAATWKMRKHSIRAPYDKGAKYCLCCPRRKNVPLNMDHCTSDQPDLVMHHNGPPRKAVHKEHRGSKRGHVGTPCTQNLRQDCQRQNIGQPGSRSTSHYQQDTARHQGGHKSGPSSSKAAKSQSMAATVWVWDGSHISSTPTWLRLSCSGRTSFTCGTAGLHTRIWFKNGTNGQ
jgi:hypothetical protein